MKILLFVFRNAPVVVVLALLAALLSGLFSGSLIALINSATDVKAIPSTQLGWQFLGLVVLSLISAIAANLTVAYLYRKLLLDLQFRLANQITQAPLHTLEKLGSSPLLAILTEDIDKIGDIATELVPLVTNLVTSLVCFGYLVWLSWQAFLGTSVFLFIGGLSYKLLISRERKILAKGRDQLDSLYQHFDDLTHGVKELKLNQARSQAFLRQVLRPAAYSVQKYLFSWDITYTIISTWGRFLILAAVGLILFQLPQYLALAPGVLTGYVLALLYVRSSLLSVLDTLPDVSEAIVALHKIESVGLDLSTHTSNTLAAMSLTSLPASWQTLNLMAVTHRYYHDREDSVFTLGPINLRFNAGEIVFLVGGNGSGKTTLVKLLTGLYLPESGEIYLDQTPICNRNRSQYTQMFAAVFTDFHLFKALLGFKISNLEAQANHYLAKLELNHKVTIQNGQLSATTTLSRGQQQRLALLIAYLEDRPFYIFDEWAANQDPGFKEIFYTELLPELKSRGKTVLVVSHDDCYFHIGDRLIKLADGQLIQADTLAHYSVRL